MLPAHSGFSRELQTLFRIAEWLGRKEATPRETLQGIAAELPLGFEHPELCRVRISFRDEVLESPEFEATPWMLRSGIQVSGASAGTLEVAYQTGPSAHGDTPFHQDERKLVDLAAQQVAQWAGNWETAAEPAPPKERKPDWKAILDLLSDIDTNMHKRLLRRLMNHLLHQGVPGIQGMIAQFDPGIYALRELESHGANAPLPMHDITQMEQTFEDLARVASIIMREADLNGLIKQWMRQDKLGLMALATEQRDIPLVEITEIVERFCREIRQDEPALSPADDRNVRVALSRRFISENLKTIRIAKDCISVYDFGELLMRVAGPAQGNGKLGGKAAGLILASHILKKKGKTDPLLASIKVPKAWYFTSDGIYNFLRTNSLEDLWSIKFSDIDEIRHNYPYLEQVFKRSFFSVEIYHQMQLALDDLGEGPLIVRSSSLLEDSEGSAFSGKYRSLFLANTGPRQGRLDALCDAVAEVYASIFSPDPVQYRAERGLLEFVEEMGVIIQRVVGKRVGKYFFPAFAGVAFSNNEFRWSPRLKREDGILRLVAGMGTRAVDRVGNDFPVLMAPGCPEIRVNLTPEQVLHYSQNCIDVINLETGRFESPEIRDLFQELGGEFPMLERIVSIHRDGILRKPLRGMADPGQDDLVVTFSGLLEDTPFLAQLTAMMHTLEEAVSMPVDVEFAHDGENLYLLQCRPQSRMGDEGPVPELPPLLPSERKLFSANKYVTNAWVKGIRYIVYVDPEGYRNLESRENLVSVADAVGRLNALLPRRAFILMGPGRWGSRGDLTLGVGVTYSAISNAQMLIEIARRKGNYIPDLSFGTHFFQDLVESRIRYLSLYPDDEGNLFNEPFFQNSPSVLPQLLPEFVHLDGVLRVIDLDQATPGLELCVLMDGEKDQALGFLIPPK